MESKKGVVPDWSIEYWAAREATLDPVGPKPEAIEFRLQHRDGEVRWLEVHWLAYFEGDGRERRTASVAGTVANITERKYREEQGQLLMREGNPPAKNMLSVVDPIAHQSVSRNTAESN